MAHHLTKEMKEKAEVYHGHDVCHQKIANLLAEIGIPNVLLSSPEIEEFCYVKPLGLVLIRLRKRAECKVIDNIVVSYDRQISACVEPNRIRKLTGIRAKEFLIWVGLSEIEIRAKETSSPDNDKSSRCATSESDSGLITFKTSIGVSRSFPVSAFE